MIDYKKALHILTEMLDKYSLKGEEKEAIITAIGTLDSGSLAKNRQKMIIENKKIKKEKDLRW